MQWAEFGDRVVPILAFLLCITVVAELADRIGVFAVLADRIACSPVARWPGSGVWSLAMVVCGLLGPAYAVGLNVTYGSAVAALILVVGCLVRAPDLLSIRLLPWQLLLGVGVLFVAVQFAHDHGLGRLLGHAAGAGTGWVDLLRLTGVAALGANVVDNLPSYLAVEPATGGSPIRLAALLVGVNAGPLITPWASLATLLWAGRCRAADLAISWRPFILRGIVIVPVLLIACTTAVTLMTAK